MTDNFDISNNLNNLNDIIYRTYQADGQEGLPKLKGISQKNYIDLIHHRSDANQPKYKYDQLDANTIYGQFGRFDYQNPILTEPVINCTPKSYNPESSRFNYAIDSQINNKMVDVSGIEIPNKYLRFIPNRGIQSAFTNVNIPANKNIEKLVSDITNISYKPADTNNILKYKISRQRLTRDELLSINAIKPPVLPQPVQIVP